MNNKLWTPQHQKAIETFYYCYTSTTSAITRQYLFNYILYQPLKLLTEIALRSFGNPKFITEDNSQECLIYLYFTVLPRLQQNKLKASQNYIYHSLRNNIINIINKANLEAKYIDLLDMYADDSYNADKAILNEETKIEIINALDNKIKKERIINKSTTIFLILFRNYLIENNFDERNFQDYVMDKMNISLSMYRAIASKIGVSTIILNKKIIDE
jgi:hypothetical protein